MLTITNRHDTKWRRSFSLFWVLSDRNPSFVWIIYSRSLDVSKELWIEMHSFPYLPSCSWRDYFQPVKILSLAIMGRGVDMMIMMMMPLWDDWWDTNTQWKREKGNISVCWNSENVKWKNHNLKYLKTTKYVSVPSQNICILFSAHLRVRGQVVPVLSPHNWQLYRRVHHHHTLHSGQIVNTASGQPWNI